MNYEFYLYFRNPQNSWRAKPSVRTTKTLQATEADEVVVAMSVNVPDALFKRPSLSATITIPSDVVPEEIKAETVDNIKKVLSQAIDLKINFEVEDSNKKVIEEDPLLAD